MVVVPPLVIVEVFNNMDDAKLEITVGHWPFSDQYYHFS